MKKVLVKISLLSILGIAIACGPGDPGYMNKANDYSNYASLADALRSVGGLRVSGGNTLAGKQDVLIQIRGESTIILNTQPLFVINNIPISNSYSDANAILNMREVTSIRVITGTHAVTRWGEEGNHGVILIKTRNTDSK